MSSNKKLSTSQIIEITGVISVVASLLFVAFELQQSNRIAIGTTEQELLQNYNSLNVLALENNDLRDLAIKLREPSSELTREERYQTVSWAFTDNAVWLSTEVAYNQELVTEEFYRDMLLDVAANVRNRPGMLFAWDIILSRGYSDSEVHETIKSVLEEVGQ